jgi:mono/diheme cytochrome c family protein
MSKRTFVIFGAFVACVAILLPLWAFDKEGESGGSAEKVPASLEMGKDLFAVNCGTCHTLEKAGADGVVGPNLDDLLGTGTPEANQQRVMNAIENGIKGRMPKGILQGPDAELVASFVAQYAGK